MSLPGKQPRTKLRHLICRHWPNLKKSNDPFCDPLCPLCPLWLSLSSYQTPIQDNTWLRLSNRPYPLSGNADDPRVFRF
jgi:hypothetical protein